MRNPLFWLFSLAFVALLGLFLWARHERELGESLPFEAASDTIEGPPSHRVTSEMWSAVEKVQGLPSPVFRARDGEGRTHELDGPTYEGAPVLIVFIKDGCPCSSAAQPFLNQLARRYMPEVRFLGVIDVGEQRARAWGLEHAAPFPILTDPDHTIIRSFGVTNSAFVALLGPSHQVEKLWPGTSIDMFTELNEGLARLVSRPALKFDTTGASEALYSGCPYNL